VHGKLPIFIRVHPCLSVAAIDFRIKRPTPQA
jgi:hypothetical protein